MFWAHRAGKSFDVGISIVGAVSSVTNRRVGGDANREGRAGKNGGFAGTRSHYRVWVEESKRLWRFSSNWGLMNVEPCSELHV